MLWLFQRLFVEFNFYWCCKVYIITACLLVISGEKAHSRYTEYNVLELEK